MSPSSLRPMPRLPALPLLLLPLLLACEDDATGPSPGDVTSLHVVTGSTTALLARPLAVHPVVELRDAAGDPVRRAGEPVTVSVSRGTLDGTTSVETDAEGRAVFRDLVVDGDEGLVELRFECCSVAPAVLSLALSLGPPSIRRLAASRLSGLAGYPLDPPPGVQVLDGRGDPLPGAPVRFMLFDDMRPVDTVIVTDASGEARLPYTLRDFPDQDTLTARMLPAGPATTFEIIARITGHTEAQGSDQILAQAGMTVVLPKLRVMTPAGTGVDGAHVIYSVSEGDAELARDTVFTVGGEHEEVTLTLGQRGLTLVEILAPGYGYSHHVQVHAVSGAVTFALPNPCAAGCQPPDFEWSSEDPDEAAELSVVVRDELGPLPRYPVRIEIPEAAGWVRGWDTDAEWYGWHGLISGAELRTLDDGHLPLLWTIPQASGSYQIQLSALGVADPWTFTATRP